MFGNVTMPARVLLGWSRIKLAVESGVWQYRVREIERRKAKLNPSEISRLKKTLRAASVEFTDGVEPGVRLAADETLAADKLSAANDE